MNSFFHSAKWRGAALALLLAGGRAGAQSFELGVDVSPTRLLVNRAVTYTINLTNRSGLGLTEVLVTSSLSPSVTLLSATNQFGTVTSSNNTFIFLFPTLPNDTAVSVSVSARPTVFGVITNFVNVLAINATGVSTNLTNQVFTAEADLGVSLAGPPPGVLVNDLMEYSLTVTNLGPGAVPTLVLSNRLPADVLLISVSPTNQAYTFTNSSLVFNLGALASGGQATFQMRVQPTNAGTLEFSARVNLAGLLDTNSANDFVSSNIVVSDFLAGQLVATMIPTQSYNPQTGLMEQRVRLSNEGTNDVPAARIIVSGLTNWLFNAWGTNTGDPFVVYAHPLAAGQSVELLLELFVATRQAATNFTMQAAAVPLPNVSPPAGTPIGISRILRLPSGNMLLEFPSVLGKSYTVLYCDNPAFSTNVLVAQPPITAPADRVQWIDYGPPGTISRPPETSHRFFRVLLIP